ncbi:MAG: two-component system sensor histidine kinase/response regulator [Chlamydiales bacterium]|jgi:two-component system sensor histidine kinase/response regulator
MKDMNRRVLLIDDTASIHDDFNKVLTQESPGAAKGLADAKAAFFGGEEEAHNPQGPTFELTSAMQGKEGLAVVKKALDEGRPFAMAFVDIRMPPGWDGLRTIEEIWKVDPAIQMVICTAYSDYSWEETIEKLGSAHHLLILKKPFDSVEIIQLAAALTEKWNGTRHEQTLIEDLRTAEQRARSYASSLETVNRALLTSKAATDRTTELKSEFLVQLSSQIHGSLGSILERVAGMRGSQDSPEGTAQLDGILDASTHLIRIFDEVLDLTRIEAGQLKLAPADCSVLETIHRLREKFGARAQAQDTELTFQIVGNIPEAFRLDPDRFVQILEQLVENALEHSNSTKLDIVFETEPTQDWRVVTLICRVTDDGDGVDPRVHGKLFEPFVAKHTSHAPEELRNPGLGLALARQLVHMMDGELGLESQEGSGATFTLRIETELLEGVPLLGTDFQAS